MAEDIFSGYLFGGPSDAESRENKIVFLAIKIVSRLTIGVCAIIF